MKMVRYTDERGYNFKSFVMDGQKPEDGALLMPPDVNLIDTKSMLDDLHKRLIAKSIINDESDGIKDVSLMLRDLHNGLVDKSIITDRDTRWSESGIVGVIVTSVKPHILNIKTSSGLNTAIVSSVKKHVLALYRGVR